MLVFGPVLMFGINKITKTITHLWLDCDAREIRYVMLDFGVVKEILKT